LQSGLLEEGRFFFAMPKSKTKTGAKATPAQGSPPEGKEQVIVFIIIIFIIIIIITTN
jgi:hypothetical protein